MYFLAFGLNTNELGGGYGQNCYDYSGNPENRSADYLEVLGAYTKIEQGFVPTAHFCGIHDRNINPFPGIYCEL